MSQMPQEVTTNAYHWVVQRDDGVGFGTTSHDRHQRVGAIKLSPDMDLAPGELVLSEHMEGSSLSLTGGLNSPALSAKDLLGGRWNGASVSLLAGDWAEPREPLVVCMGELGDTRLDDGRFAMTIDVLPSALHQPPCVQTSPECRAVLGDRQCRVNMRSRRKRVRVVAVDDDGITVDAVDVARFAMGRLRWITGEHCGVDQLILAGEGSTLVLQDDERFKASEGDYALLNEGCDGRRSSCSERFGNIQNFRGEPDLPGSEILLRFPGV